MHIVLISIFLQCLCTVNYSEGSRILLSPWVPFFNSRFDSMLGLADYLVEDGHEVSVLIPTFLKNFVKDKTLDVITFNMDSPADLSGLDLTDAADILDVGTLSGQYHFSYFVSLMEIPVCEHFYADTNVQKKLKSGHFDLLFADTFYAFTRVVIDFMDIPTMLYSPDGTVPDNSIFYPIFPSYVCPPAKSYCGEGDRMPFWIRLKNFISEIGIHYYLWPSLANPIDDLRRKYKINTTVQAIDSYSKHIVIANIDGVIEPARPLMPHIIAVPGLFVKEPQALKDADLALFMDSAKNGAIVMSLGTLMNALGPETDKLIAEEFNSLPQKVVWKYDGTFDKKLNPNVILKEWIPQQDLLAHKSTKLFITHGGSHSMFEAGYRGVPVVCIPFFLDQFAHCKTLAKRLEMGVILEPTNINRDTFRAAIKEVLHNPKYATNAKRIQSLLLDQPVKSKDLFLYWVNYAIRHKGAHHLVARAPFEHNIIQYLSLDVVAFLISLPLLLFLIGVKITKVLCRSNSIGGLKEKKLK